ncbi:MAG: tRNA (adenosine(37)-N6)-threonylcarbamoyltransferase complex dimerization subunit type 1 TsaB [Parachlamydiales bacterium]|nr:tRNA (adenosine(37)-N6)-threonylcarbamoyltransferase complex dimerization subunit type 1 TsaB [Parachlamydiales bacterium]
MVYSLIIDTSSSQSLIALGQEDKVLAIKNFEDHTKVSHHLFREIALLLRSQSLDISHLVYIAVSIGPGSYTGIRSGVSIAQAFVFGLNIPFITFSSLEGFVPEKEGLFCAISYANSGGLYYLLGEKRKTIAYTSSPQKISLQDSLSILPKPDYRVSPDYGILSELFPKISFIPPYKREKRLLEIAWNKYLQKDFSSENPKILYLKDL